MSAAIVFQFGFAKRKHLDRKIKLIRKLAIAKFSQEQRHRLNVFLHKQKENRLLMEVVLSQIVQNIAKPRSVWSRPRSHVDFWQDRVLNTYEEFEFVNDFRMKKETFLKLCDLLRVQLEKKETYMRKSLSVERRVAISLYKLATPGEYRTIGNLFGVARNTVCVIFHEFCQAVTKLLVPAISYPSDEGKINEIVKGFLTHHGFPQCAGAIDGCHIPIIGPEDFAADYYNRKGWHSILLQAVVDFRGRFLDIDIGWPGSVHDARVLANSAIYRRAENNELLPNKTIKIDDTLIPLMIVGDPAYPLKSWLMKGFSERCRLTRQENNFNNRLSSARVQVEHAFGRLKGRWRILLKRSDCLIENVINVVATACAMHNYCEENKERYDQAWESNNLYSDFEQPRDGGLHFISNNEAKKARNALMKLFWQQDCI